MSLLERRQSPTGVVYYAAARFGDAGIPHGFSTRLGGVSAVPFAALNLGNPQACAAPDPAPNVAANYALFQAAIGCAGHRRQAVHQVHGAGVVEVSPGKELVPNTPADALIGNDPDCLLSIRTADCVPILLATPDGRWVGAVHAGWRGLLADVLPAVIAALVRRAGQPGSELIAAIGPCIGGDAFEVSPEIAEAFAVHFGSRWTAAPSAGSRPRLDLRRAAWLQLRAAGIPDSRIATTDRCTHRDADEFFSHRRDAGLTGRHAALIAPRRP